MKLLSISVPNGFRFLKKGFTINFLTKTRVPKDQMQNDLFELEKGLYYPYETIFLGKNSSGKSSAIDLLASFFGFLSLGRFRLLPTDFNGLFTIDAVFYEKGIIYRYQGSFENDAGFAKEYPTIKEESLSKTTWKAHYKKDLSNISFSKDPSFVPNVGGDTSNIAKLFVEKEFTFVLDWLSFSNSFGLVLENIELYYGRQTLDDLVRLFDDSVEHIQSYYENDKMIGFKFKRKDTPPIIVDPSTLNTILSKGTTRGILLFGLSLITFRRGGQILVDEIERNFNRNLIEYLMLLFNDPAINKTQATIIYSTHYAELLDHAERCDNINVLHRNGTEITIKNLEEYNCRSDLVKSNQFNQNVFDTFVNYEQLMRLRRDVAK